jgi:trk system potassium uptake protein
MKVTVAGAGNVGVSIARDLKDAGHQVLLIEQDPDLVAKLRPTLEVSWYEGDACEVSTLHHAGMAESDVVVAATGDDEDNLVVSLLAKQEFAVPRVVARVNHPKNQWLFNESWGVDVSVPTPLLLTALVEEAVSVGSLVRLLQFAQGQARLVEVTLADDGPANGHPRDRHAWRRHHRGRGPQPAGGGAPGRHRPPGPGRGTRTGDRRVRGGGQSLPDRRRLTDGFEGDKRPSRPGGHGHCAGAHPGPVRTQRPAVPSTSSNSDSST